MHQNPIKCLYNESHVTLWCLEVGLVAMLGRVQRKNSTRLGWVSYCNITSTHNTYLPSPKDNNVIVSVHFNHFPCLLNTALLTLYKHK